MSQVREENQLKAPNTLLMLTNDAHIAIFIELVSVAGRDHHVGVKAKVDKKVRAMVRMGNK
jgi:hypothetical protein